MKLAVLSALAPAPTRLAVVVVVAFAAACQDEPLHAIDPIEPIDVPPDTIPGDDVPDVDPPGDAPVCAPIGRSIDAWGTATTTTTNRSVVRGPAFDATTWRVRAASDDDALIYASALASGDRLVAAVDDAPGFFGGAVVGGADDGGAGAGGADDGGAQPACSRSVEARSVCDGALLWRTELMPSQDECFVSSTRAVGLGNGAAYVAVRDGFDVGTSHLNAYDVRDGQLWWSAAVNGEISKVAATGVNGDPVFVVDDVPTMFERASGAVVWNARGSLVHAPPSQSNDSFSAVLDLVGAPLASGLGSGTSIGVGRVIDEGVETGGALACSLVAFSLVDGARLGDVAVEPCDPVGGLVVGGNNRFYALALDDDAPGSLTAWDLALDVGGVTFTPAWQVGVAGYATAAVSPGGDVFLLHASGDITVFDDESGHVLARRPIAGGDPNSSFALVLDAAGNAFVATNVGADARIEAFDAHLRPSWSRIRSHGAYTLFWDSELSLAQGGALVQAGDGLVVFRE